MVSTSASTALGTRSMKIGVRVTLALATGLVAAGPASALVTDGVSQGAHSAAGNTNSIWALVNGNTGGLAQSDGHVATSQKLADSLDGQGYRVTFDRRVRECSFAATVTAAFPGDIASAGRGISVTPDTSNPNAVIVKTMDVDGSAFVFNASSFSLQVECA